MPPLSGDLTVVGNISHNMKKEKKEIVKLIIQELKKAGIDNEYIILGTLGTIGKECGFKIISEGTKYSFKRLKEKRGSVARRVWKRFEKQGFGIPSDENLLSLSGGGKNGVALFNIAYGYSKNQKDEKISMPVLDENGNINPKLYDPKLSGYKYRGRGPVQVTFKSGYETSARAIGLDLEEIMKDIESVNKDRDISILLTAGYMKATLKRGIKKLGEPDSVASGLEFAIRCVGGLGFDFSVLKKTYNRAVPWIYNHFRILEPENKICELVS